MPYPGRRRVRALQFSIVFAGISAICGKATKITERIIIATQNGRIPT